MEVYKSTFRSMAAIQKEGSKSIEACYTRLLRLRFPHPGRSHTVEASQEGSRPWTLYDLLAGYHGEPKVNLFHNIRII